MSLKALKILAVNILVLLAAILVWTVIHYKRVRDLKYYDQTFAPLPAWSPSEEELTQLGWVDPARQDSHFSRFPLKKPEGVLRIGIFGESFVAGAEVGPSLDFPSLMQARLGKKKYQILNFGGSGYSFHQAYLFYQMMAKKYELDRAVFFLMSYNFERDLNFVYPENPAYRPRYGPVHTRYVLKENKLERISVDGRNRAEAAEIYNSMFPPLKYVRYNFYLPPFLRSLLPYKENYRVNPFYFRNTDSLENEAVETYLAIFDELADQPQIPVDVFTDIPKLKQKNGNNLTFHDFDAFSLLESDETLYKAACCHPSPMGNLLISKIILSNILGVREDIKASRVDIVESPPKCEFELEKGKTLLISQRNTPIAMLSRTNYISPNRRFIMTSAEETNISKFKSMLIVPFTEPKRLVGIPFFHPLEESDIKLSVNFESEQLEYSIAKINTLGGKGVAILQWTPLASGKNGLKIRAQNDRIEIQSPVEIGEISIFDSKGLGFLTLLHREHESQNGLHTYKFLASWNKVDLHIFRALYETPVELEKGSSVDLELLGQPDLKCRLFKYEQLQSL